MNWDKFEIGLLVSGALIAVAGAALGIPTLSSVGVGLFALDIAALGLEGILTRKMKWGITYYVSETYQGLAAVGLGLIMLVVGLGFGALVVAQAFNQQESLFEAIWSRPGLILLILGGLAFFRGVAGVIGAAEWDKPGLARVGAALERLASAFLVILGALVLALGGLELIAPGAFRSILGLVWQMLLGMLRIS